MDCSPSGSSVHGNLQARILEWVEWIATWLSPDSRPEGTHWPWPPHCPRPGARSAGTFREAGPSGIQLWQVTPAGPLATSNVCFHKKALSRQPAVLFWGCALCHGSVCPQLYRHPWDKQRFCMRSQSAKRPTGRRRKSLHPRSA